jgi:hypothetical protein
LALAAGAQRGIPEVDVTASEELTKVPARAKQAEDRAAAAQNEAKDCFGQDVESAPASAQGRAESRRQTAHNHTESVSAENRAQRDEHDAVFAVAQADPAADEAECGVLDASLAKVRVHELRVEARAWRAR